MRLAIVVSLVLFLGTSSAPAQPEGARVFDRVLAATVWILSPYNDEHGTVSMGTGTLVDAPQRLVITACHVVGERPETVVFFAETAPDGTLLTQPDGYLEKLSTAGIRGTVVARLPGKDLALIQLERIPTTATPLPVSQVSPRPGDLLHGVGNSGNDEGTLWRYSSGQVRQVYEREANLDNQTTVKARMVETQVPTNKGDSGGPLANSHGELVAVICGGGQELLVQYAIDVSEIRALPWNGKPLGEHLATPPSAPVVRADETPAAGLPKPWESGSSGSPNAPLFNPYESWAMPHLPRSVLIQRAQFTHNVERNGQRGLLVTCDVSLDGYRGVPCEVHVVVCDADRNSFRSHLPQNSVGFGNLGAASSFVPLYDQTQLVGAQVFLPYSAISAVLPSRIQDMMLALDVFDAEGRRYIAHTPEWQSASRRSPAPVTPYPRG